MNIKKILTTISISCLGIGVFLLILGIFKLPVFEYPFSSILLTLAVIVGASTLSISAYSLINKNKILSIVALALLGLISLLGIIIIWANFKTPDMFNKITAVIAITTALFNIIVSFAVNLGKRHKSLQIATYIATIVIDIILTLLIFGVNVFFANGLLEIFLVICLVDFFFLCALAILNRRTYSAQNDINDEGYIKIKKTEYMALVQKVQDLEAQLKEKNE